MKNTLRTLTEDAGPFRLLLERADVGSLTEQDTEIPVLPSLLSLASITVSPLTQTGIHFKFKAHFKGLLTIITSEVQEPHDNEHHKARDRVE